MKQPLTGLEQESSRIVGNMVAAVSSDRCVKLSVTGGAPSGIRPIIARRNTLLGDLDQLCGQYHHVFVVDPHDGLVGVVASHEVSRRLASPNERERERWQHMPIGSLLPLQIPPDENRRDGSEGFPAEAVAVSEGNRVVALATRDDVYISLRRVAHMLSTASTDALTGVMNRAAYERRVLEEWNRATRSQASVAAILVDVDHFKELNDSYGHLVGDVILRSVAATIEGSLRSYDFVARYGGDEFVVLCFGCRPGEIEIPITRIQRNIRKIDLGVEMIVSPVSVSIGAAVRHGHFEESSPSELMEAADACLYQAKEFHRGSAFRAEFDDGSGRTEPVLVGETSGQ